MNEDEEWLSADSLPYDVQCARCGKILSCVDAFVEEGDEWECEPCNTRCNEEERAIALKKQER